MAGIVDAQGNELKSQPKPQPAEIKQYVDLTTGNQVVVVRRLDKNDDGKPFPDTLKGIAIVAGRDESGQLIPQKFEFDLPIGMPVKDAFERFDEFGQAEFNKQKLENERKISVPGKDFPNIPTDVLKG